jgi:hypothetical protein
LRKIEPNALFLRMVIIHAILVIILFLGSSLAQSAQSSNSLQAEATVEIQYDGEVGSGIILMTSYPVSCTTSVTSNSSTITSSTSTTLVTSGQSTTPTWTFSTSSTPFNTPPIFGTSRTQMINATSTSQYLFQTATSASQTMTGTIGTQNLSSTPSPHASPVAGSGTRFHVTWSNVTWSHVFIWAAVAEIVSGFL